MKCLKCGHDQKRGREGMTCTSCATFFIFDPKSDNCLTDSRWAALVARTSAHGRYPYFESQLRVNHAQLGHKVSSVREIGRIFFIAFMVLCAISWGAIMRGAHDDRSLILAIISPLGVVVSLYSLIRGVPGKKFALEFDDHLRRWRARHELDGMLPNTTRQLEHEPKKTAEEDIYDYGVECVLLVSEPSWVDFFVLGGFHAAQRCLVLCINGYPSYLTPELEKIIQLQPSVPVFLLHDVHERPDQVASMARRQLPAIEGKALMNISLQPGDLWQMEKMKPLVKLCQAVNIPESLMLLPPQQVHSMVEAAINHRATLHELLRGERDDSSSGFIGHDGGEVGAFDLMVLSDFG